jgi:hypothetical protein
VSNDGASWVDVASGAGAGQLVTVSFAEQSAQYVKVTETASGVGNWWSIAEFNVYSAHPPTGTPLVLGRTGWVTSASASGGGAPANAIDGSESSRWSTGAAQTAGQWFQVDLGSAQTFDEVTIDAGPSNGDDPAAFTVAVSNDGATWSQVASGTGTSQLVTATFAAQTAEYVRITQTSTGVRANWWSIAELNLWTTAP